jgi:hypothetical protein
MKKLFLVLPIVLAACSKSNLRIAVRTDCKYEKVAEQEYGVVKVYALYNMNGTKEGEWKERGFVGAASHEYICFDDFAIEAGCPRIAVKGISGMHGGVKAYCIANPE